MASEACEVWPSLTNKIRYELQEDPASGALGAGESRGLQLLKRICSKFPVLMPSLVRRLALTDDIVAERNVPDDDDAADAGVPDRSQDISTEARRSHYGVAKLAPSAKKAAGDAVKDSSVPEFGGHDTKPASQGLKSVAEIEDSGRDDTSRGGTEVFYRGRDAAIEAIAWLAEIAETEVVANVMPIVGTLVKAPGPANSRKREAAFAAISAIADRNPNAFDRHAMRLEPVLLAGMKDPSPCVRASACVATKALLVPFAAYRPTLEKLMQGCVALASDGQKYVQRQALSCILSMFDELQGEVEHLCTPVATAIVAQVPRLQIICRR